MSEPNPPKASGEPRRAVWEWLMPPVQQAVRSNASAESTDDAGRELVIAAMQQVLRYEEHGEPCRRHRSARGGFVPLVVPAAVAQLRFDEPLLEALPAVAPADSGA